MHAAGPPPPPLSAGLRARSWPAVPSALGFPARTELRPRARPPWACSRRAGPASPDLRPAAWTTWTPCSACSCTGQCCAGAATRGAAASGVRRSLPGARRGARLRGRGGGLPRGRCSAFAGSRRWRRGPGAAGFLAPSSKHHLLQRRQPIKRRCSLNTSRLSPGKRAESSVWTLVATGVRTVHFFNKSKFNPPPDHTPHTQVTTQRKF